MICHVGKEKDLCHTPSHLYHSVLLIPMEQWANVRKQMFLKSCCHQPALVNVSSSFVYLWPFSWYYRYVCSPCDIWSPGWQIISYIPTEYKSVDIYNNISIKSISRLSRPRSALEHPVLIKSEKSKIPSDFTTFLKNSHNKTEWLNL